MTVLKILLWLPVTIIVTAFAVMNLSSVAVDISPLHEPASVPIFLVAFIPMAAGFLLGSFTLWLNMAPLRQERRHLKKTIKSLEKELSLLESEREVKDIVAQDVIAA